MVLASQNIEDFLLPNIREMTKPLFSMSACNSMLKTVII